MLAAQEAAATAAASLAMEEAGWAAVAMVPAEQEGVEMARASTAPAAVAATATATAA